MDGVAVSSGSAWDDADSADRWRRDRRVGRIWLAVGLVLFSGFLVYVTRLYDHRDELTTSGVRTSGVVLESPRQALRCTRVPVPVRFRVAGRAEVHKFFVDGCSGDGLHQGDKVAVWYDPTDPNDFVVNGKANEKPVATLLACVALIGSGLLIGAFAIRARRLHTLRRILRAHPWRPARARVAGFSSPWTHGRDVVELSGSALHVVLVTQAQSKLTIALESSVLAAGAELGPFALCDPKSGHLILARTPRSDWAQQRAQSALEQLDRPIGRRLSGRTL